jgi:septum formation protein
MHRRPLYLASASPRRKLLLEEAGFAPAIVDSGVDDAQLRPGASDADDWTTALAYLKAAAGRRRLVRAHGAAFDGIVLGADTVVVKDGAVIGQARDEADARCVISCLEGGEHDVVSGVALLACGTHNGFGSSGARGEGRLLFSDVARVRVGRIGPDRIEAYLRTGSWRGKAGAYNLSERIADGWPVECDGDPATVMGLPMRRLTALLREFLGE